MAVAKMGKRKMASKVGKKPKTILELRKEGMKKVKAEAEKKKVLIDKIILETIEKHK